MLQDLPQEMLLLHIILIAAIRMKAAITKLLKKESEALQAAIWAQLKIYMLNMKELKAN